MPIHLNLHWRTDMMGKKVRVKPHKRKNPKSSGKHRVSGHTRELPDKYNSKKLQRMYGGTKYSDTIQVEAENNIGQVVKRLGLDVLTWGLYMGVDKNFLGFEIDRDNRVVNWANEGKTKKPNELRKVIKRLGLDVVSFGIYHGADKNILGIKFKNPDAVDKFIDEYIDDPLIGDSYE